MRGTSLSDAWTSPRCVRIAHESPGRLGASPLLHPCRARMMHPCARRQSRPLENVRACGGSSIAGLRPGRAGRPVAPRRTASGCAPWNTAFGLAHVTSVRGAAPPIRSAKKPAVPRFGTAFEVRHDIGTEADARRSRILLDDRRELRTPRRAAACRRARRRRTASGANVPRPSS